MDKPIQIMIEELKDSIVSIINDAKLPMCVITPIVKDVLEQCNFIEKQQLELAKKEYSKSKTVLEEAE